MKTLGKQIQEARNLLHLTQWEVAEALQVARTTVSNWECGRSEPDLHMLHRLSDALHLHLFNDYEEENLHRDPTGRKLRLKLSDSPVIEVISPENACVFSAGSIDLHINGSDSQGNSLVFRVNAAFCVENDGE